MENKLKTPDHLAEDRDVVCKGADDVLVRNPVPKPSMRSLTMLTKCILQSAWNFRDLNTGVYGITGPMLDVWTSTETVVDVVLDFFNLAERRLSEMPEDSETPFRSEFRLLFPQLASAVFRAFQERQDWLER